MGSSGELLQQKLAATRRWWRISRVITGVTWVLSLVLLLALICYHSDRLIVLSVQARETWRTGIGITAFVTLALALLQPLLRRLSLTTVATDVERHFPVLGERLLTTLHFAPALAGVEGNRHYRSMADDTKSGSTAKSSEGAYSEQLISELAKETVDVSSNLNFTRAVSLRPLRNGGLTLLFTLLLLLLHVVFSREAFATWMRRMADPRADIPPYAKTRVQIVPDKTLLARGDGTFVTIKTWGDPVDRCVLRIHQDGDGDKAWTNITLSNPKPVASSDPDQKDVRAFRYQFRSLPQSITLIAAANDGRSNEKDVKVEDRPTLLNVRLSLHFPDYMHRKDQIIPETTGAIAAPVGTSVSVVGVANKPLRSATFVAENGETEAWPVTGVETKGQVGVKHDGGYRLKLRDTHDFTNTNPPRYEIRAIKDEAPTVQILRPATDLDLVPGGSVPLIAHATDDYGVSGAKLVYDSTHEDNVRTGRDSIRHVGQGAFALPAESNTPYGAPQVDIRQRWNIASVSPKVGDIIKYEVDCADTDTLSGPHLGHSLAYRIRVVSTAEMQAKLKEQLDAEQQALAAARQHQLQAQQQVEQARAKNDPAKLAQAQDQQRNVASETKALAQRVQDLSNQLQNNNFATPSQLERRQQAQQTLDKAAQEKMTPAADKVQQAQAAKANSAERNQDLQQADQQQTQAKQDLEKAQQLLDRTPTPQQLAKTAKDLAEQQNRLADSSRSLAEDIKQQQQANKTNALAPEQKTALEMQRRQQAQVNNDTRKLEQQLAQAAKEAQERGDTKQAQDLNKAAEALKQGDAKGNQNQAQQKLNQNNPQQAAAPQDKAANALSKAAEDAAKAANGDKPNDPQSAAEKAQAAAQQLRELAQQQREVAKEVGKNPNAEQSKELANKEQQIQQQAAQAQQNLEGAQKAQQSAQKAQQNLGKANQQLSQNQPKGAQQPAQDAAQQLEDAAKQAQNAADQLKQQAQAQELADKAERLAQIQRALQNTTERLDNQKAKNNTLTGQERLEQRQLANRQNDLENKVQELTKDVPSKAFQQALQLAGKQMHPANENLNGKDLKGNEDPDTGKETQAAQRRATQTLGAIAQALKQQAQANQQQQQQAQQNGQQQPTPGEQQTAEAAGELALAQALQQQLRQDTGQLDQQRAKNPNQALNQQQQREERQITEGQRDAEGITKQAAENLENSVPNAAQSAREAGEHMERAKGQLQNQVTGQPTQGQQDQAIQKLDQANKQAKEAMEKQQQEGQQKGQVANGAPQPGKQPGNQPKKDPFARLEGVQKGNMASNANRAGKGFSQLSSRDQRVLRDGETERVPAEYQDLVSRYYKSLAEKKR